MNLKAQGEPRVSRSRTGVGDSSFPGRMVTGLCMIVGPTVLVFATLFGMDDYKAAGLAYVHLMGQQMTKTALVFDLVVQPIHDRMPVILSPSDYDRWLEPGDPDRPPVDLLRPFPPERMTAWQVGAAVGNTKNDSPELRLPLKEEPQDLFSGPNSDSSAIK